MPDKPDSRKPDSPSDSRADAGDGRELLSMSEAIEMLKTTRATFYRWLRSGKVEGMKVGRQWRFYREEIERFLHGEQPRIELAADPKPLLDQLSDRFRELAGRKPGPDGLPDQPVEQAMALLVQLAVRMRATDVTIEPVAPSHPAPEVAPETGEARIRARVDGVLQPVATFDHRLLAPVVDHWKRLSGMDVNQRSRPQDGRVVLKVSADDLEERVVDVRVCVVPAVTGESITLRVLRREGVVFSLDRFGYAEGDRQRISRFLDSPHGICIVTGPIGCGKTTTLYAMLAELAAPERKVMSIEDPVEYLIRGVTQVSVNPQAGMTFPVAVRSILRSATNVVGVGETRDGETLQLCIQAALTGHLVLTTLHTNSAVSAIRRMLDIGAEPFLVADATRLFVAQRLVRRLCPECSEPVDADADIEKEVRRLLAGDDEGQRAGDRPVDLGRFAADLPDGFRKPVGCSACARTGFRGRTLIAESVEMTGDLARAVRDGAGDRQMLEIALADGTTPMVVDGLRKAGEGVTTVHEVARATAGV